MSVLELQQGVAAIQAGNREEGARLLRIAIRSAQVLPQDRSMACVWLADAVDSLEEKQQWLNAALLADPNNDHAKQRLALLLNPPHQPPQVAPPAAQPYLQPPQQYPNVGGQIVPSSAPQIIQPPPAVQPPYPTQPSYPVVQTPQYPMQPTQPPQYPIQPAQPHYAVQQPYQPPQSYQPHHQPQTNTVPYKVVGIVGGPVGPGTGFFVTRDGLIATSRYVVGSSESITIELERGRQIPAQVVRSFPELDLALLTSGLALADLLPITPLPAVPDNVPLVAVTYNGGNIQGRQRPTKRLMAGYWFPTTIEGTIDQGGNPVFDENGYLLGMLIHNDVRKTSYVFGLHIAAIYRAVEIYQREMQTDSHRAYCNACGSVSRAPNIRNFYCEICGSALSFARDVQRRHLPQADALYGENNVLPCPHCGSQSGYWHKRCLRCGGEVRV